MTEIQRQKTELRKNIRASLDKLSYEQKLRKSSAICFALCKFIKKSLPSQSTIASYAGLNFEPDLLALHQLMPDYRFAYPKCGKNNSLDFHLVTSPEKELLKGFYGIREPDSEICAKVPAKEINLFLVPAFAYTTGGERLGKGGGYYDRVLEKIDRSVVLAGVVFSEQIIEFIPTEPHDIPVSSVITDDAVYA